MKKKKLLLLAAGMSVAMLAAACGQKESAETTASETTEENTDGESTSETESETVSQDDPELTALLEQEVPEVPKLSEMGTITLADFSSIEVTTSPMTEVTDEMVESQIQSLLDADLVEVDEAAGEHDTVNIDYVGTMDGVEFDGGSSTGYDLELGSGTFIDGFEDQLVGTKAGDQVTVKVTFPENYGNADLAGKPAEFAVTVNAVKRAPELTDEWVKNYEDTDVETVDEFKAVIRAQLEASFAYSYHSGIQQDALTQIVDASDIELSDAMKEYATAYVINAQSTQMANYGFSLADMINMYGMTVDEFKEEMAAEGEEYGKQYFVIQQVAADQKITLTDELMDKLAEDISAMAGRSYNRIQLITQFGKELVESEAVNDAVMEYIESQVQVTVEEDSAELETEDIALEESDEAETEENLETLGTAETETTAG